METTVNQPAKAIIVQGIPSYIKRSRNASNKPAKKIEVNRKKIEALFSNYGSIANCDVYMHPFQKVENFAHITFSDSDGATKAHAAAANHEIEINDHIITVTLLSDDCTPIEQLDDLCLMNIFSLLDNEDRFNLEKVCQRWKGLALRSWYSVKEFDNCRSIPQNTTFEECIERCGHYLNHLSFFTSSNTLSLVKEYCENLTSVTIYISNSLVAEGRENNRLSELCALTRNLKKLKRFVLSISDINIDCSITKSLPESMEEITIKFFKNERVTVQDFSKFQDLQKLELRRLCFEDKFIVGIETLKNLTYLNIAHGGGNATVLEQVKHLSSLKFLDVSNNPINDNILIKIVKSNCNLEYLDISATELLTDESLQVVSTLPCLKSLRINDLPEITLTSISAMPNLEYLNCLDCDCIGDEGLQRVINSSPVLQHLNAVASGITDQFLIAAAVASESRDNGIVLRVVTDISIQLDKEYPLLIIEVRSPLSDYQSTCESSSGSDGSIEYMDYYPLQEWLNADFGSSTSDSSAEESSESEDSEDFDDDDDADIPNTGLNNSPMANLANESSFLELLNKLEFVSFEADDSNLEESVDSCEAADADKDENCATPNKVQLDNFEDSNDQDGSAPSGQGGASNNATSNN